MTSGQEPATNDGVVTIFDHCDSPVALPLGTTLAQAARALVNAHASAAVVGSHPYMILTERDLVRGFAGGLGPADTIDQLASPAPLWVTPATHAADAARMMVRHGVRHLVVLRASGEVVGVLAAEDLLPELVARNAPATKS